MERQRQLNEDRNMRELERIRRENEEQRIREQNLQRERENQPRREQSRSMNDQNNGVNIDINTLVSRISDEIIRRVDCRTTIQPQPPRIRTSEITSKTK